MPVCSKWQALLAPLLLGAAAAAAAAGPGHAHDAPRLGAEPASTQALALPIVVNTWAGPCFGGATAAAWAALQAGGSGLDAVEQASNGTAHLTCLGALQPSCLLLMAACLQLVALMSQQRLHGVA